MFTFVSRIRIQGLPYQSSHRPPERVCIIMKSEIVIQLRPQPPSAAVQFLSQLPGSSSEGSDLLRSIRTALRGSTTDGITSSYAPESDSWAEQELSWTDRCAVLSHGGVIRRKWDFTEEQQTIQYACLGRFVHSTEATGRMHGSAHYTSSKEEYTHTGSAGEQLFGPFKPVREETLKRAHNAHAAAAAAVPAVFVFLRCLGRVFLADGLEYTFALPFLVRRAWPLCPHGVLIQRSLEPAEVEEARVTGDALIPTMFSITNAIAEPAAVGVTAGIVEGASLSDEAEQCSRPLVAVPAAEEVVWVSPRKAPADDEDDILITYNGDRNELTMWRYVYIKPKDAPAPVEHGRMKAVYWVQQLATHRLACTPCDDDVRSCRGGIRAGWMSGFSAALFDRRYDGVADRALLALCVPGMQTAVYALTVEDASRCVRASYLTSIDAVSVVSVRATRAEIWDLLAVKADASVSVFTHGLCELPIHLRLARSEGAGGTVQIPVRDVVEARWECVSSVTLVCSGGEKYRARFHLIPQDPLVSQALRVLSLVLPKQEAFDIHRRFLETWTPHYFWTSSNLEFHALSFALSLVLDLKLVYPFKDDGPPLSTPWAKFCHLAANCRSFVDDPALQRLTLPARPKSRQYYLVAPKPNPLLVPVLYGLHMLAEDLRLVVHRYDSLVLLVPLICHIAHVVRPEWVDYWKRLCPNVMPVWPSPSTVRK